MFHYLLGDFIGCDKLWKNFRMHRLNRSRKVICFVSSCPPPLFVSFITSICRNKIRCLTWARFIGNWHLKNNGKSENWWAPNLPLQKDSNQLNISTLPAKQLEYLLMKISQCAHNFTQARGFQCLAHLLIYCPRERVCLKPVFCVNSPPPSKVSGKSLAFS
jgi:hypothetical protein